MPSKQIYFEDVEAGSRQVVREAPRREMPRVAILTKAMDEKNGGERPAILREEPLPDHRERDRTARHHDLFQEVVMIVPIDCLSHRALMEDQCSLGSKSPP